MTIKRTTSQKVWNIALWVGQILLAFMFLYAGSLKTFTPIDDLAKIMPFAGENPTLIRFIGIVEVAGGLGLLLPAALRILPQLTIVSAIGFTLIMVLAFGFHVLRGEYAALGTNVVLGVIAAVVAWGRWRKAPITNRFENKVSTI
ncbi:MAG TPA: DoxX family protein [Chryseosolibacter sp.]